MARPRALKAQVFRRPAPARAAFAKTVSCPQPAARQEAAMGVNSVCTVLFQNG